jgi:PAS domain S-box-containing protein
MFFRNKNPLLIYFLINFFVFCIFIYSLIQADCLTTREYVDYASDNTIAMLIILFVSYNLSRIHNQALASLKKELAERKKAETSLREFRVLLTSIINSMPSIIIGVDERQSIVLLNEETTKLTGLSQEDTFGRGLSDVLPQLYFIEFNIRDAIQEGKISHLHKQPVSLKENDSFMDITIYPFLYGDDKGAVIRLDNITERIQMEDMVAQSEKMALVGEVAGNMAHDFNNVLSIIMGNVELSMMTCHDPRLEKRLELIYNQTVRGKNLTKNLIAFAKDQEPKQEFFNINDKIDLVITLMKKDLDGIELVREERMGLPDLLADSGMIEHALVNLIQNAIHATSTSENPQIIIRSYQLDDNICIEIDDNGCGLAEEHFDKIYSPTFTLKGSNDTTNSYDAGVKGTGYGMYNVKKYIQQHKGSIDFQSTVGFGTNFTITLPVIKKE